MFGRQLIGGTSLRSACNLRLQQQQPSATIEHGTVRPLRFHDRRSIAQTARRPFHTACVRWLARCASQLPAEADPHSPAAADDESPPVPVSLAAIRKAIRASGQELHDGYACLRTVCPICPADDGDRNKDPSAAQSTRSSVFVNKTTGTVVCARCQLVRSWPSMEPCFQQRPGPGASAKSRREWDALRAQFMAGKTAPGAALRPPAGSMAVGKLSAQQADEVRAHLNMEMFSVAVLGQVGALCVPDERTLHFPLVDVNGTVVGYKTVRRRRNDAADDGRPDNGRSAIVESTEPPTQCAGVLQWAGSRSAGHSTAVLVLSVADLLALAAQRPPATVVVCLPYGFRSLPQQCLPALERFGRLALWFANDTVSWDTARSFAKKLDERRCVFVRPTEAHPAPFEALTAAGGLDARQILAGAQPILHKAITTFAALRQDVLSELQNVDRVQGVRWTRFPVLNRLLRGHRRGELTVLTGPTGCGKTTFMAEYSLDLAQQGVSTLWGSFEIRNTRLATTLLRQLAGHPFDEQQRLAEFDRWANEFERLPMYFMTFHGQQSIRVVMETIEHAQYVHDIQHVIIDNVQFMMGTADEPKHVDRFWRQDAIIAAFRTFATKRNCHVTLVIHPRKERDADDLTTSSIFGGAKATQEADNVLIIQDKRLTAVRGKKYLQVAKNRYSGDLGIMPMDFDKQALSYACKAPKNAAGQANRSDPPPTTTT